VGVKNQNKIHDMKVVITSTGDSPDALVDRRFGRCHYFVVYDTLTGVCEFIPNPGIDHLEGAGVAAVNLMAEKGVKKVVSGEFGTKVKSLFDQLQVQLVSVSHESMTVRKVIEMLSEAGE
jgi:predicted Fe-Mo cluster-binding NifX family protein